MIGLGVIQQEPPAVPGQQIVLGAGGVILAAVACGGIGYVLGGKEWGVTGALVGAVAKGVLLAKRSTSA